jgi:4-amino-4-deoxy-L-arabinose transferase-like glycosyltransferase
VLLSSAAKWRGLAKCLLFGAIFYFLFFWDLTGVGALGPDEPRYAAIGREMARSGDWITPRLWGEPWFEKPALLYWLIGVGFRAGLSEDLAPRLPVALISVGFLLFYYWILRREFEARAALFATAILGTSAGWLSFSHVGVTDLPMAAAFSAAMLLCLPWIRGEATTNQGTRSLSPVLLGLAVLAKGLVPLVLALPLGWVGRRRLGAWLRPAPMVAFVVVAAPWYVLCALVNGSQFLSDFFLRHHVGRFSSDLLQHEQPLWFYVPVLLGGLFPWTPLVAVLFRKRAYADPRRQFFLLWLVFGLVFFSVSLNKLPGYLLPLLPAASALLGLGLAELKRAQWLLAASAVLLVVIPVIAAILPEALLKGLTHVTLAPPPWLWLLPVVALAGWVWWQESRAQRLVAVWAIVVAMTAGVVWLKATSFPALDSWVSARVFWRQISGVAAEACVEDANRSWLYSLNYYSGEPLPGCKQTPRRLHLRQAPGSLPELGP